MKINDLLNQISEPDGAKLFGERVLEAQILTDSKIKKFSLLEFKTHSPTPFEYDHSTGRTTIICDKCGECEKVGMDTDNNKIICEECGAEEKWKKN